METPERTEFFAKLAEGADRLAALASKANALDCTLLAHDLMAIANQIHDSIAMQRRALVDRALTGDPIRRGLCPVCKKPKEESIKNFCPDRFHLWFCGADACPGHQPGALQQRCADVG